MSYQEPVNYEDQCRPYLPGCSPLNLSSRGRRTREYLDTHKNVEKRRRDRINNCLETIRQCVPACRQIPLARRLEKGEILDMTISYLQLVNHFLAGIGIQDVYSASKQQVQLYMGVDNWIREHHGDYNSVSDFAKALRNLLQNEIDVISTQVTIEHSWSSRKTSALGENLFMDDHIDNKLGHSSCSGRTQSHFNNGNPSVPSTKTEASPSDQVTVKQEWEENSAESHVKRLKFSQLVDGVVDGAMKDEETITDCSGDVKDKKRSSTETRMETSPSSSPHSKCCNFAREAEAPVAPLQPSDVLKSCHCAVDKSHERTNSNTSPSHMLPSASLGDIKVSTSTGSITIPIRLGSIQIEAPKEMLQPLQQACIQPVIFNAQLQSSAVPSGRVADKCSCKKEQVQPLTVQIIEERSSDSHSPNGQEDGQSSLVLESEKDDKT